MSQEIYVLAYDGEGTGVLDFAIEHAKKNGAQLHIAHILEWSPYKFLTPEELSERHKRRPEELKRADDAIIKPALEQAAASGLTNTSSEVQYGSVVELIAEIAKEQNAALLFVGRASGSVAERVFGSVPLGLAQVSTVPVVIVP